MIFIIKSLTHIIRISAWLSAIILSILIISLISLSVLTKLPNHLWPYIEKWTDNRLSIEHSTGTLYQGLTLHNLKYQDQYITLSSETTAWRWTPFDWLSGRYQLEQLNINHLKLNLLDAEPTQANDTPFELASLYQLLQQPFSFIHAIPIDIKLNQINLTDITITQADEPIIEVQHLDSQLSWQAKQLSITELNTAFFFQQQRHQAWLTTRIFFKDADTFEGDLKLTYSGIEPLSLLSIDSAWSGRLTDLRFDLNTHTPISTQAQHHWKLTSEQLELQSDWNKLKAELLDYGQLSLNPSQTLIRYFFEPQQLQVQTNLDGQLGDWPAAKLALALDLLAPEQTNQSLSLDLKLDLAALGNLSSQLQANWTDNVLGFDWLQPTTLQLHLQSDEFSLLSLNKDWDYRIDSDLFFNLDDFQNRISQLSLKKLDISGLPAKLAISGQLASYLTAKQDYQIDAKFDSIHYDHFTIKAQLDALVAKSLDGLTLHQLHLTQSNNTVTLTGLIDQFNYQLELDANLEQLDEFLAPWNIAGQAKLKLHTLGLLNPQMDNIDQAWLEVQLASDQLTLDDIHANDIKINANIPLHQPAWGQIDAQLGALTQGDDSLISGLKIQRRTQSRGMQTELSLQTPYAQLELGTLERQPNIKQLNLDLERILVTQPQTGIWLLNQPTQLYWDPTKHFKLDASCFALATHPYSQICLSADGQQLNWRLTQLPILEWAAEFIPENLKINTQLEGQGFVNWQDSIIFEQHLEFERAELIVSEQGFEWPVILNNWHTQLHWNPTEARIESQARINDTGHLGANIQIFPEQSWNNPELDGYIRLQLNEWMLSEHLTRHFELQRTELNWQTLVMGTLDDIQHTSRALVDIDFDLPLFDLKQQNLLLQADIANEALNAFGRLTQPNNREARINLHVAPLNAQAKVDLDISTESIEIVKTPFAHLFLGTDIQLQLDQAGAVLRGEARIHDSYLDLDKMPLHQRTSVSKDEIIMTNEGEIRHEKGLGFPLDYSIKLKIGNNVRINVREAQAYLGGGLTLSQTPDMEELQAQGDLLITSGHVELDRRNRLLFEPSSFSFTGNIENPRLNVNLFRQVDRTTARLNITGTPTQPQFVFYANPPQSQARIINLLDFGGAGDLETEPNYQSQILTAFYKLGIQNNAPALNRLTRTLGVEDIYFDVQNQQVSSLLLGKALTNEVYIRYAHDLSGRQNNAMQIFYQLTPRWLLKSDNRGESSSVDLIFQQERD